MIELHNADCLEIMKGLPDNSVDLIATDPPYFSTNLHFDKAPRLDFKALLLEFKRLLKPHGIFITFADFNLLAELRSYKLFKSAYEIIWHKVAPGGFLDAKVRPLRSHEFIGVFVDGLKKSLTTLKKPKARLIELKQEGIEESILIMEILKMSLELKTRAGECRFLFGMGFMIKNGKTVQS